MFGLSYRELDVDGRPFIFPTTTPTQFEPQEMRQSILRLLSYNPEAMYLTHYSRVQNVHKLGEDLLRRLDVMVDLALAEKDSGADRHQRIKQDLSAYLLSEIRAHGCQLVEPALIDLLETDLELNAQGLSVWLDTQKA